MKTEAYACYLLSAEDRARSSSGGAFFAVAKKILENNGVVYGACYSEQLEVIHKRIDSIDSLKQAQGSKYAESILNNTFQNVVNDLLKGHTVLFSGTPCQCAGLLSFIRVRKIQKDRLFVVDCVCHGVPSPKAWKAYLAAMENKGLKLKHVNMRDKSSGWTNGNYSWYEVTCEGKKIYTPRRQSPYMIGMLKNYYTRPSCYECRFKGVERSTDMTLGDYWGVENYQPDMDDNKGTSLVFIHTEKGRELFDSIKQDMKWACADIVSAVKGNPCITESTNRNPRENEFYQKLRAGQDFISVINSMSKETTAHKILRKVRSIIKRR